MSVSAPVIREYKVKLANLALLILGQHLWSYKVSFGDPTRCLCKCCEAARRAYQDATGLWPTSEQETAAMDRWAKGEVA